MVATQSISQRRQKKHGTDVSGVELLKLEYMKAHRNAYGERMSEAQERQLERRLTKLCQMN